MLAECIDCLVVYVLLCHSYLWLPGYCYVDAKVF